MDKSKLFSLDIETSPSDEHIWSTYGLEPWRQRTGDARITSVCVAGPDNYIKQIDERAGNMEELPSILKMLEGKTVIAQMAIFDIAWMLVKHGLHTVQKQNWKDTQLLGKWIINGQNDKTISLSLKEQVRRNLPKHPLTEEFLDIKSAEVTAGVDYDYWLKRGQMDAILTLALYKVLRKKLHSSQRTGYDIEQRTLPTIANSWVTGLTLDVEKFNTLEPRIIRAKKKLAAAIGVAETVIQSPQQLRRFIEDDLSLVLPDKTAKRVGSTAKESLMKLHLDLLAKQDKRLWKIKHVLDFKQLHTMKSKFVDGVTRCVEYLGENKSMSTPKIFATYTGRYTYANKVLKKNQVGLATHQLPRKGPIRQGIIPPEGHKILELDAAGQEMRFMAHFSQDEHMVRIFNQGMKPHGSMGAYIAGDEYEDFMEGYKNKDKEITNNYMAGKLLNLSCQYRIGGKALAGKFFSNYQIQISEAAGRQYENIYKGRYPGVPKFWASAIHKAREDGYAETIAGRRFKISNWRHQKWGSESSAINFPIQGSGAEHKNLSIAYIAAKFPELVFVLDLHDGLWYYIPEENHMELGLDVRNALNKLKFHEIWNVEKIVEFPFDAQIGDNFLDVKEI